MTHSRGVAGAVALVRRDARVIARAGLRVVDLAQALSPTRPSGPAWRSSARRRPSTYADGGSFRAT